MAIGEALREEIRGFQQARADLLRWKLIAVGAIATAALGLPNESHSNLLLLVLVPLVTIYCDLLVRDYDVRIDLIATFLRKGKNLFGSYEKFIRDKEVYKALPWALGNAATLGSSLIISILILVVAIFPGLVALKPDVQLKIGVGVSAIVGIIGTGLIQSRFSNAIEKIRVAPDPDENTSPRT